MPVFCHQIVSNNFFVFVEIVNEYALNRESFKLRKFTSKANKTRKTTEKRSIIGTPMLYCE